MTGILISSGCLGERQRAFIFGTEHAACRHHGTSDELQMPNNDKESRHGDHLMNRLLTALTLGSALACTSLAALAGATSPDMGPPPSQTGIDPRVQGSDPARQGADVDTQTKKGISIGGGTSMSNGTGNNNDADLPGGDTTNGGGSKGSGSSSAGGAGG